MDELQQTWRTVIKPLIAKYDLVFPKPFFTPLPTKFDLIRLERDIQQRIDNFGIDIRDLFSCLANGITDGPRRGGKPLDLKRLFWGLLNSCFKERTLPALLRHLKEIEVVVARPADGIPERERPELPRYADYVFRQACELHDLEHGPCEDVARKQIRLEQLRARIESISKDCTREIQDGAGSEPVKKGSNTRVNPTLRRVNSKHFMDRRAFEDFKKRYTRGKEPMPTKAEIIRAFKEKKPECKDIPDSTIRNW